MIGLIKKIAGSKWKFNWLTKGFRVFLMGKNKRSRQKNMLKGKQMKTKIEIVKEMMQKNKRWKIKKNHPLKYWNK